MSEFYHKTEHEIARSFGIVDNQLASRIAASFEPLNSIKIPDQFLSSIEATFKVSNDWKAHFGAIADSHAKAFKQAFAGINSFADQMKEMTAIHEASLKAMNFHFQTSNLTENFAKQMSVIGMPASNVFDQLSKSFQTNPVILDSFGAITRNQPQFTRISEMISREFGSISANANAFNSLLKETIGSYQPVIDKTLASLGPMFSQLSELMDEYKSLRDVHRPELKDSISKNSCLPIASKEEYEKLERILPAFQPKIRRAIMKKRGMVFLNEGFVILNEISRIKDLLEVGTNDFELLRLNKAQLLEANLN